MLETIFEWITSIIGELLEGLVNAFMGLLKIDIGYVIDQFPVLASGYTIFRTIGIGIAVIIASVAMVKFFTGDLSEVRDTPILVLLRLAISIFLIYYGSYALEWVINIAKIPYDEILSWDAVNNNGWDFAYNLLPKSALQSLGETAGIFLIILSEGAILFLYAIIILIMAWNIMKFLLEVLQRFMWLFVILFTAPLAFATFSSKNTANIMQSWLKMFFSQCLLLVMSVWILKAVVSGFSWNADQENYNFIFQFLGTLALCKVGTGIDREVQKLGLNATTAGGDLADRLRGDFRSFSHMKPISDHFNTNTVLGNTLANAKRIVTSDAVSDAHPRFSAAAEKGINAVARTSGVSDVVDEKIRKAEEKKAQRNQASAEETSSYENQNWETVAKSDMPESEKHAYAKSISMDTDGKVGPAEINEGAKTNGVSIEKDDSGRGKILTGNAAVVGLTVRNSIGRTGEGTSATQVLQNTVKNGMSVNDARHTILSKYGNSINKGSDDATSGMLVRKALGNDMASSFGIPNEKYGDPSTKLKNIGLSADSSSGKVTTTFQYQSAKPEQNGQLMTGTIVNSSAYEGMSEEQKKSFTALTSSDGKTIGYAGVAEDYTEKRKAQITMSDLASGHLSPEAETWNDKHTKEDTFRTAYNEMLPAGTKTSDISNVKISKDKKTGIESFSADVYNRQTGATERYTVVDEGSTHRVNGMYTKNMQMLESESFETVEGKRSNDSTFETYYYKRADIDSKNNNKPNNRGGNNRGYGNTGTSDWDSYRDLSSRNGVSGNATSDWSSYSNSAYNGNSGRSGNQRYNNNQSRKGRAPGKRRGRGNSRDDNSFNN